jgi:hypothetical protein
VRTIRTWSESFDATAIGTKQYTTPQGAERGDRRGKQIVAHVSWAGLVGAGNVKVSGYGKMKSGGTRDQLAITRGSYGVAGTADITAKSGAGSGNSPPYFSIPPYNTNTDPREPELVLPDFVEIGIENDSGTAYTAGTVTVDFKIVG